MPSPFPAANPFTIKFRDRQKRDLYRDIEAHLMNPQNSIPSNARQWKMWVADRPASPRTKLPITDNEIRAAIDRNKNRLKAQIERMEFNLQNPARRADLLETIADNGIVEQDVLDIVTVLRAELVKQEAVDLSTPAKIITECNRRISEFTNVQRLQD